MSILLLRRHVPLDLFQKDDLKDFSDYADYDKDDKNYHHPRGSVRRKVEIFIVIRWRDLHNRSIPIRHFGCQCDMRGRALGLC